MSFKEEQAKGLSKRKNEQNDHDKKIQGRMSNRTKAKSFQQEQTKQLGGMTQTQWVESTRRRREKISLVAF